MTRRDIAFALLISAVWGLNFVAVKFVVEDFPPLLSNALRFSLVILFFMPFIRIVPGRMVAILTAAFTLGVLHFGAVFTGMSLAGGVGGVAIASQLSVPFSTLLAVLFLHESVGWKRIAGIALSFTGVLVLSFDPIVFEYWQGLLIIMLAALLYAISTILMRKLKDVRAATLQGWVAVAGVIGSLLFSIVLEEGHVAAISNASGLAWAGIAYSAVGSSVLGHGGANYLFRKYEVSTVSPYFLAVPFFAVLGAVVILGEDVSFKMVAGGLLTVAGILIVTLRNKAKATQAAVLPEAKA
ncbi:MAG: hypothetical protein COB37_04210 [Kordiimonadales bacterium]|nr:MAG: hypothetical protein COB37_04210 [Kordiimonadales bacterium]